MAGSVAAGGSPSASSDSLDQIECNIIERKPGESSKKSLFDEDESSGSDDDSEDGGAKLADGSAVLKINEDYARRFEHNKKREERQKLEEKHGRALANGKDADDDSESSDGETEDEEGFLATEDLDAEISATLQAIKNKDPRIYDDSVTFYRPIDEATAAASKAGSKEKPVTLKDYHRERYMKGDVGADFEDGSTAAPPPQKTYVQEQDDLKKSILNEINALAEDGSSDESDGDAFIKKKAKQPEDDAPAGNGVHPSRATKIKITEDDVVNADKDPELFLSNFMSSRAWLPPEGSRWEAFESDEEDKDNANFAEEFENAYNMRFEDPEKSNEVLKTYSRSLVAEKSVRREEKKGRKRQRELEKERKEAEKQERREERARLRRLKIEEAEEKLQQIKKVAGFHGKELKEEDWIKILDDNWDDEKWEAEMRKQFGDDYYAEGEADANSSDDEEAGPSKKKRKPKKPKWDDDIDIKDIVPDFDDSIPPNITLTDDESEDEAANGADASEDDDDDEEENPAKKRKTSKDHKKDRAAAKRAARQERAKIEALVDQQLELDDPDALASSSKSKKKKAGGFRYRETSPNSFGLTAHDILLAPSDAVLNEFAGLKKLATFRDAEKKRKDKKHLGKKARLRQWRRDNFGREYEHTGPTFGFERVVAAAEEAEGGGEQIRRHGKSKDKGKGKAKEEASKETEKSRKRKRSRGKAGASA